ncbi:hypothetical protein [Actinoplanes sp. NBRC 101535]|uniref:hypothetical protein n=1 Tax=Actinoplanes sp. NBRC 101535 TaxID=3032196 RepID=UPI00255784E1|nr:hypothetical protein [Actinoplanes sp. NBRC 101535]
MAAYERRRFDAVGSAAIVLTVDAVVLLGITLVGLPFLIFLLADETETTGRLAPLAAGLAATAILGAVSTLAAVRFTSREAYSLRRLGTTAVVGTAAAAAVLVATSVTSMPLAAALAALFVAANLAAAPVLARHTPAVAAQEAEASEEADILDFEPTPDPDAEPDAEPIVETAFETAVEAAEPVETSVDEAAPPVPVAATVPRRRRNQAALHTMAGVRLPRRAHR